MRKPQAFRPERPTLFQGAILIASCMVASIVMWGFAVILLAFARYGA